MRKIWESAQIGRKVGAVALVIVLMNGAFFWAESGRSRTCTSTPGRAEKSARKYSAMCSATMPGKFAVGGGGWNDCETSGAVSGAEHGRVGGL